MKSEGPISGFYAGDIVLMDVVRESGEISWYVNGKKYCQYTFPKLVDKTIKWMPFIPMKDSKDRVVWVENQ